MVLNGLGSLGGIGVTGCAFAVAHYEHALDALVFADLLELSEVLGVLGFVLKELIDVFDGVNSVLLTGDLGEVEVCHVSAEDGSVERPLGEGDGEPVFWFGLGGGEERSCAEGEGTSEEVASIHGA